MSDDPDPFDITSDGADPFDLDAGDANFAQADIDALFGGGGDSLPPRTGIRALVESRVVSHERLPMFEVVCERMMRSFATAMRNLTSDVIDVSLEDVQSVRFADFMNRVELPSMLAVFSVRQWENFGLVVVDAGLIFAIVDAMLGGRRGKPNGPIDGRAFTPIETDLVARMVTTALNELSAAFEPIADADMTIERIETNPRFAAIAGPSNIASVATFRLDMDGRGGCFSILFPAATIEPVKAKLVQRFMGEKPGRDSGWAGHMDRQLYRTPIALDAALGRVTMDLRRLRALKLGDTIEFGGRTDAPVRLAIAGIPVGEAEVGQRGGQVAIALGARIEQQELDR